MKLSLAHLRALRGAVLASSALLLAGAVAQPVPPLTVPDTLDQRVQPCAQCHGKEGRSTNQGYFPRIAGKPAGYLFHQLVNFRERRRQNETMSRLVEHLTDAYLREIADHFASLDLPYPPPRPAGDPATMARGEALVRRGDAARGLPACVECHGSALTGTAPFVPGLVGLSRDYLSAQFGAWRTGQRQAQPPDCMARIAAKLSGDDVAAVATWLAAQPAGGKPVPAGGKPVPAGARALPMPCGGVAP